MFLRIELVEKIICRKETKALTLGKGVLFCLPLLHGPRMHHPPAPCVWRRMTGEGTRGTDYAFHITFTAELVAASGRSSAHAPHAPHAPHARRHTAAVTAGAAVVVTDATPGGSRAAVRRKMRWRRRHGRGQRLLLRRLHGVRLGMHGDTIT